jgi:hypothetical protein
MGRPVNYHRHQVFFIRAKYGIRFARGNAMQSAGKILVTLDRGDYWQCAFVIQEGAFEAIRQRGIEAFTIAAEAAADFPGVAAHSGAHDRNGRPPRACAHAGYESGWGPLRLPPAF